MAFLTRLRLSHFRSHKAWGIETDGRPLALYGPNGAGKTNVLEAVSMLSPGRGLRRAQAEELIRRPENIGWKVSGVLRSNGEEAEVVTAVASPGQRRSVEIDGKAASQTALGALAPMVWLTPAMDRLWMEGAAERRRFIDRAALAFEPAHGDRAIAYEKAMRERNRLLKEGRADPAWLAALEAQMARSGAVVARARAETVRRLTAAQDGAATAFPRAEVAIEGPAEARFAEAARAGEDLAAVEAEVDATLTSAFASG
ncbi:MAG: DNA replication and repair protein RecF, partial [Pseudomonadota bacterium]